MSFSLLIVVVVVAGLVIGSFLTVVVDRVPQGGSVNAPPSRCGSCGLRLGPLDLVPVFSWLALRGKCRRCRAPIGIDPIVIELANAALYVLMAIRFDDTRAAIPAYCILMSVLLAQTWIDLQTQRLPREITYTGIVLGAVALSVAAIVIDEPERIWMMALGAAIALAAMWLIYAVQQGRHGRRRRAPRTAARHVPGLAEPRHRAARAVLRLRRRRRGRRDDDGVDRAGRRTAVPFGPFLAVGTIVAIFVGQHFVDLVLAR
jgi:leader peptidase (prepilin peptidase) / N-methyltransferase